ncbi:MAG: 30S ribosomal protein S20 [bacterium]
MPKSKSPEKRARTSKKNRARNRQVKTVIRNALKKVRNQADEKSAADSFKKLSSILDKAVKKGVIHKNKAARSKSSVSKLIKSLTK